MDRPLPMGEADDIIGSDAGEETREALERRREALTRWRPSKPRPERPPPARKTRAQMGLDFWRRDLGELVARTATVEPLRRGEHPRRRRVLGHRGARASDATGRAPPRRARANSCNRASGPSSSTPRSRATRLVYRFPLEARSGCPYFSCRACVCILLQRSSSPARSARHALPPPPDVGSPRLRCFRETLLSPSPFAPRT